jgi:PhzF family phenazine biosynthesis protein
MGVPYYHVDAFTAVPFAGNPAGVCILDKYPDDALLRRIAAENGHSQTAFVVARGDGEFDLRWFTPTVEDDLCGHATLATAHVLAARGHGDWPVRFHTRSGVLTVHRSEDGFALDLPLWPPEPCEPPAGLLHALGVGAVDEVMRSTRDYLVVLPSAADVRALRPDVAALGRIEMGIGGVIATAPGNGEDADYVVRFFAPGAGIPEDPATGSISCTLAPYWAARLGRRLLRARQLSARGGELACELTDAGVRVHGRACVYLSGTIDVDA